MKILKSFFTVSLVIAVALQSKAQDKFSSYDNTYEGKSYEIQISSKEKDKYKLYILSPDHLKTMMGEEKTDNFIKFIKTQFPGKF
jgi:hypothetical protein